MVEGQCELFAIQYFMSQCLLSSCSSICLGEFCFHETLFVIALFSGAVRFQNDQDLVENHQAQ